MKIKIYTTPSCGYCGMAKKYFEDNGIDYQEILVNSRALADELRELSGSLSVPLIIVEKEKMLGWDENKFKELYNK